MKEFDDKYKLQANQLQKPQFIPAPEGISNEWHNTHFVKPLMVLRSNRFCSNQCVDFTSGEHSLAAAEQSCLKSCVANFYSSFANYNELKNKYIDQMEQLESEGRDLYFERGIPAERH